MLTYGYDSNSGMEKTASDMMKDAEVRGVVAAFCDAGLVKVASAEAFDDLTEKVAYCLNDYYTVDDVADATSYVIKVANIHDDEIGNYSRVNPKGNATLEEVIALANDPKSAIGEKLYRSAEREAADAAAKDTLLETLRKYLSAEGVRKAKGVGPTALEALKYGGKVAAPVAGVAGLGLGGKALYDYISD